LKRILRKAIPKLQGLERLLIDTDVKPTLLPYLGAVGFNVLWVRDAKVNYHDDVALVKYARRYHRILLCHDRHRDKSRTDGIRIRMYREIYERGGQVIEIAGSPSQDPLTSLGKILVHRHNWRTFFDENDGIVVVREASGMVPKTRDKLIQKIQGVIAHPTIPPIPPKVIRKPSTKQKPHRIQRGEEKTFDDLLGEKA
jgi:hypothetical protein